MAISNQYSLITLIKLMCFVVRGKLISRNIRLIRFPIEIRGRRNVDFGRGLTTGVHCRFETFGKRGEIKLQFGKNVQLNDYVHITAMEHVTIGDNVLMASHVYISDCTHGFYNGDEQSSPLQPPIERAYNILSVDIGDNTWLGEHVCILPGVKLGKGCVVGANTVVTKSFPDYCMIVGSPARIVKRFSFEKGKWLRVDSNSKIMTK